MLPFREASVGQPILAAIVAAVVLVAASARYQGIPVATIGWVLLVWSLVWLVGEIIANGTARTQMNGSLIFREANMRSPGLLGAVGSILLLGRVDQEGSLSAGRVLNGDAAGDLGRGVGRAGAVDADGDREVEAVDGSSPRGRGYGVEVPHRGAVAGRAGAVR